MLAIRLQRTGRSGHAQFRLIVQEASLSPTSGKVVAQLGSYNPHTKDITVDKEKASFYLEHGAQPSERVALLLKKEGVKLPKWVADPTKKEATIRNPEKLRKNRPAGTEAPAPKTESDSKQDEEVKADSGDAVAAEDSVQTENTEEAVAEAPADETEEKDAA